MTNNAFAKSGTNRQIRAAITAMLLTCENCETIFRIEAAHLKTPGQKVRCSVCKHVWAPEVADDEPEEPQLLKESMGILRLPVLICAILIAIVSLLSFNRGLITAYVPSAINLFDMSGLVIRPDLDKLEVRDLKANYAGDTLRISGMLANKTGWRIHAAPMQLTINDDDGVVLHTQMIAPSNRFIEGNQEVDFFIQLTIEGTKQAEISVTPLAIRLTP